MLKYQTPSEYYFRIHHVRPRFKDNIEDVLFYMAKEISALEPMDCDVFAERVNSALYQFPGNAGKTLKTINNWRTEISSLFGFIRTVGGTSFPGTRAVELAERQDLVEFFKTYLFSFQYPGAHIKSQSVVEQIEYGIHFKPAQSILKILHAARLSEGKNVGLSKGEICHCIFNDLRCTRDNEDPLTTWNRIKENRESDITYDLTGDVIRYAGDIVDYMEIANLLVTYDGVSYYLNKLEEETIIKFMESGEWFNAYDKMIERKSANINSVNDCRVAWFDYVNRDLTDTDFSTDIISYIANDEEELARLTEEFREVQEELSANSAIDERLEQGTGTFTSKEIGDMGEALVFGHERMRVKVGGREDLVHLITRMPTALAVGYDINSVELDATKRFVEVKTTISSKPLLFNSVHLTPNEWNMADTVRERYYVYRLMISKNEKKLFLLCDPVGLYKSEQIQMTPGDGADITFNPNTVGHYEELLTWKN